MNLYPAETYVLSDGPIMECGIDVGAEAMGDGIAMWEGATFYWFAGLDRSSPIDSLRVPGGEVRRSFNRDSISAAREELSAWDISGRAPFDLEMHFRFLVKGESVPRTAELRFTCGPAVPAGGALAPVLTIDAITAGGEVEPGDTVSVTFSATSAFGLWVSGVAVTDAFFFELGIAERMLTSASNTVHVGIPWHATLGALLDIDVFVIDGMLQAASRVVGNDIRIVDHTPPRITSTSALAPEYAVGQRFSLDVNATDNHRVRWLVYEFGAPVNLRDSVPALAEVPASTWTLPFTVQPGWVGATTLRLYVRDAAGHASDVVTVPSGGITFVPAAVRAP